MGYAGRGARLMRDLIETTILYGALTALAIYALFFGMPFVTDAISAILVNAASVK